MAKYPRPHRLLFRRTAVLIALIMAGGGLVALEHTATGASTGTPSSSYGHTSSGNHGGRSDPRDHHHHGSTTTSTSTSTTTSTTMPPKHCRDKDHDRKHHDHKHHCRPPSGGQKPKPPHHPHDPYDKHSNKNGHR
jgi:hypothetical protein